MATRADLVEWVEEALRALGGSAKIVEIAKEIWRLHQNDLEGHDLFYTWQYDMRWAGLKLSKQGKLALSNNAGSGRWALVGASK